MDYVKEFFNGLKLLIGQKSRLFVLCIITTTIAFICFCTSVHKTGILGYYVSCGFGILAIVLILVASLAEVFPKLFGRSKTLDNIKDVTDGFVKTLADIQDVTNEINDSFKRIQRNTIMQTFIGSNTIAGNRDFAYSINAQNKITIERYFFISNAYDINFAVHSLNSHISDNIVIKPYIWTEKQPSILADIFTNITLFPDKVIFTFSSRDDHIEQPEIFKSSESKDAIGLSINSKKISAFISNHYLSKLHKIKQGTIDEAKRGIWNDSHVEYVAALVYSIIKEISTDKIFSIRTQYDQVGYSGVIGSFAKILNGYRKTRNKTKFKSQDDFNISIENLSDIDVLLFVSEISKEKIQKIEEIANEVCRRYKISDTIEFRPTFDMSPIKPKIKSVKTKVFIIQLILNDSQLHKSLRPSKLVVCDRLRNNVGFFKNKSIIDNYGDVRKITVNDLLDEPQGLISLKKQLSDRRCLIRYWSLEDEVMRERQGQLEEEQLSQFAKYATKWSVINFCRAYNLETSDSLDLDQLLHYVKEKLCIKDPNINKHNLGNINVAHQILDRMLTFSEKVQR